MRWFLVPRRRWEKGGREGKGQGGGARIRVEIPVCLVTSGEGCNVYLLDDCCVQGDADESAQRREVSEAWRARRWKD